MTGKLFGAWQHWGTI